MKIDKAIEILDLCVKGCNPYLSEDTDKARKLGIEALKRLKYGRNHPSGWELEALPGETKEE